MYRIVLFGYSNSRLYQQISHNLLVHDTSHHLYVVSSSPVQESSNVSWVDIEEFHGTCTLPQAVKTVLAAKCVADYFLENSISVFHLCTTPFAFGCKEATNLMDVAASTAWDISCSDCLLQNNPVLYNTVLMLKRFGVVTPYRQFSSVPLCTEARSLSNLITTLEHKHVDLIELYGNLVLANTRNIQLHRVLWSTRTRANVASIVNNPHLSRNTVLIPDESVSPAEYAAFNAELESQRQYDLF